MAGINKTVSAENPATLPLTGAELTRIVQSGNSSRCTTQDIANLFQLPTTTKGDLMVNSGTTNIRFPAGANGTVPVYDSTQTSGLNYGGPYPSISSLASSSNGGGVDLIGGSGRIVNSISQLRALLKTGVGKAFSLGYYTPGDGGGGQYYYDSTDTTSSDNGGTIIVASDGGRWKLVYTDVVSIKQFGAKSDGTDCSANILAGLNAGVPLYAPPTGSGSFNCSINITQSGTKIVGAGKYLTKFKNSANAPVFTIDSTSVSVLGVTIEGIWIENQNTGTYPLADGIYITGDSSGNNQNDFHTFKDLYIFTMRYGIIADHRSIWNTFERVVCATSLINGLYVPTSNNVDQWTFKQCRFANSAQYGVLINHNFSTLLDSWKFETCDFENNGYNGLRITGTFGVQGFGLDTCHFENNCTAVTTGSTNPRKANIFVDSVYAFGLEISKCTLYNNAGGGGGNPDWHIYVDTTVCVNVTGSIDVCRFTASTNGDVNWQKNLRLGNNIYAGTLVFDRANGSLNLGELSQTTSWTPNILLGGANVGMTYANQRGIYQIVGRCVNLTTYVSLSSLGSSTGAVTISGLPFTSQNITNLIGTIAVSCDSLANTAITEVIGRVLPNSNVVTLYKYSAGTLTNLTNADLGNSSAFSLTGSYLF